MKILFVSATEYAVEHFAGPYIEALDRAGHEIHVLTGGEIGNYAGPDGIVKRSISLSRKPDPIRDFAQVASLAKYMKTHQFSVVYSISPKGGLVAQLAARLAGVPHRIHFVTGQTWKTRSGFGRSLLKNLDKLICHLVTKAYVDSRSQVNFLVQQGVLSEAKAVVLASGSVSGVEVDEFVFSQENRVSVRKQYGLSNDEILIFFLGRISSVKGVQDLVSALQIASSRDPRLRLLIVGPDDGDAEAVKAKISELGLDDIVSTHWASTPRPAIQYSAAEILCVPSYMEGFGNVVLEAACAGVPTVGSDIYGLQDAIVDEKTGLLFELGNPADLAEKLLRLSSDAEYRRQLGDNALKRVRAEFSREHLVDAFMDAHEALLE